MHYTINLIKESGCSAPRCIMDASGLCELFLYSANRDRIIIVWISRGVHWVMHKCIMVKVGVHRNTHKVCKKQVNYSKTGAEICKSRGE